MNCSCITATPTATALMRLMQEFGHLRKECPALRQILIPDNIWTDWRKTVIECKKKKENHQSKIFLAFIRGYLNRITSPIHRYLFENDALKANINHNYKRDLVEDWLKIDKKGCCWIIRRHQKSRGHQGKLTELICAKWLEDHGWIIQNLEALNGNADIEAKSPENIDFAIQVKYIGQEDEKFLAVIRESGGTHCLNSSSNFILFKVYEGAKQFNEDHLNSIVCLVIEQDSFSFNQIPIDENWMDWSSPTLLEGDRNWNKFFEGQKKIYGKKGLNIINDLQGTIHSLNEIWFVKEIDPFKYSLHKKIRRLSP